MDSALRIALEHAQAARAERIEVIRLRVGRASGVVPDALRFAFDVLAADTIAEGAALEIDEIAIACRCDRCEREFRPETPIYACPACGVISRQILTGREMELCSMEVS